jgi:hypothetical protein
VHIKVNVGDLVEQVTQAAITVDRKAGDLPSGKIYFSAKKKVSKTDPDTFDSYLYLFSTNQSLKTFIRIKIAEVIEEGQLLVDHGKLLGGLLGRDPDFVLDLEALPDEGRVRAKIGKNKIHIPLNLSVDTFVNTIKTLPSQDPIAKISATTLIAFIKRSGFCIPLSDNGQQKFAIGVLNLEGKNGLYTAQATDGRIVAYSTATQTVTTKFDLQSLLLPVESLDPLNKILQKHKDSDVDILAGNKSGDNLQEVFFRIEGILFGTVLRAGTYPKLSMLLDQNAPSFVVDIDKEELQAAVARAATFVPSDPTKRSVTLAIETAKDQDVDSTFLKVKALFNEYANLDDEIPTNINTGDVKPVDLLISLDYLGNVTNAQSGDNVSIGFNYDRAKAVIVKDEGKNITTTYAIMPIIPEKKVGKKVKKDKDQNE